MSNLVFPALPGTVVVDRIPTHDTRILSSSTKKEQRVAMQPAELLRITLRNECLRTDAPGGNEVATLKAFFTTHRGRFDSFLYDDADPATGVTTRIRVRFDDDELPLQWVNDSLWAVDDFDLVQVP